MIRHDDRESARAAAEDQLQGVASKASRWMFAAFRVTPDSEVICDRTSWEFPPDKLGQAIQALILNYHAPQEVVQPLPRARLAIPHQEMSE